MAEPFTFTAFADEGIPGPSLDRDPSLLPESDWGMWNNGSYDPNDPDRPARTHRDTTSTVITQITTMVLRFINEQGRELDRVVFSRIADGR